MRKWIYMFMAAGLLLSACVKENRSGAAEGTPVLFSASTVETRTTYSGQVTDGYERINWSENDQIKINCPQTTPTSATYKIGSGTASGKQSQATGITCISGNQLQWGSDTHRFFAVYPSSADLSVSGTDNSTKGTMSGTIPATQDGSPALSSYGYMFASATESNPGMYQSVNLAFRPLFNAVEFSLKAGDPETAAQLTSIVLSSDSEYLAGPFSAEWTAGSTAPTVTPGSSGLSQSVTISTDVSLSQSTASKFTFITMPITQNNLKLTLNYANYSRTLTLKNGSGTAVSLSPGERVVFGEISVPKKIVHVMGVTLNHSALNMTVGGADQTLTATVAPNDATDKSVSWSSNNTSVATVTDGVVHAVGAGTATITVTTTDGSKTATCTVTVTQPVSGVSVSPTSATLNVGGTQLLTATVSPSTASNQNVTWSSSNTSVATVSNTGLVTAVATGTATITVTTADGSKTATCAITVIGVSLNKSSTKLKINDTETLTATVTPSGASSVSWSTSNSSVATVSGGTVHAVATGTATITARVDGGATATCTVTVISVSLNKSTLSMTVGGSNETLTATVTPSGASSVSWSTNNSSVATVSGGTVHAVAAGTATITATVEGGAKATCTVTVTEPNPYVFTFKSGSGTITTSTPAAKVFATGTAYVTATPFTPDGFNADQWQTNNTGLSAPQGYTYSGDYPAVLFIQLNQTKAVTRVELDVSVSATYLSSFIKVCDNYSSENYYSGNTTLHFSVNQSTSTIKLTTYLAATIKAIRVYY